jgi:hypothetical protein
MKVFRKNTVYKNIYFSGSGYLCAFQLGVVLCFISNRISFENCYSTSAGCVGAMAMAVSDPLFLKYLFITLLKLKQVTAENKKNKGISDTLSELQHTIQKTLAHKDLGSVYSKLHFGARNIYLQNVWLSGFRSQEEIADAILATTRLLPFVSLHPHNSYFVDQLFVFSVKDIVFDCLVSPFVQEVNVLLPPSFCNINGDNGPWNLRNIVYPELDLMSQEFIKGYKTAARYIQEPIDIDLKSYLPDEKDLDSIISKLESHKLN